MKTLFILISLCCNRRGSPPQAAQQPTSQPQPEPAQAAPAHTAQPASTGSPVTQAASQQISQAITSQGLTKM